jgi:hypothetical protein
VSDLKRRIILIALLAGAALIGSVLYTDLWNKPAGTDSNTVSAGNGSASTVAGGQSSGGSSDVPSNNTKISIQRKDYSVKGKFDFKIDVPSVTLTGNGNVEKLVTSDIEKDYDKVMKSISDSYSESGQIDDEAGASSRIYRAVATVSSKYSSAKTISIAMSTDTYGGGAHGYESVKAYNYVVSSGKRLTLGDILGESKSKLALVNSRITKHMDDEGIEVFDEAKTDISFSYGNFYVDENNLTIFFNPYDIASYAAGYIAVKIPLGDIGWTPY